MRGRPARAIPHLRKALSFINFAAREINCKIVYYGAGLGGKTTNLQVIYQKTADQQKGKMISLATETERTLFFDFLPLDLGKVRGFKTRIHLYTVPGQVFYDASRKLILRGVDGIVFVADSQEQRMDANVEALDNLMSNLKEHGYDFNKIPYVLQLNKRDLPNILPVDLLDHRTAPEERNHHRSRRLPGRRRLRNPKRNRQTSPHRTKSRRLNHQRFPPCHAERSAEKREAILTAQSKHPYSSLNSARVPFLARSLREKKWGFPKPSRRLGTPMPPLCFLCVPCGE